MSKKEKIDYSEITDKEREILPTPLSRLLALYEREETSALRKVHRLIDALEWAVKWHTLLVISDLLRERELPAEMKVMLSAGLQTPSLGTWMKFFREGLGMMSEPLYDWKEAERLSRLEEKYRLVAFRNKYAHGATPEEEECRQNCQKYYPVLLQLIGSPLFTDIRLLGGDGRQTYLLQGQEKEAHEENLVAAEGQAAVFVPTDEYTIAEESIDGGHSSPEEQKVATGRESTSGSPLFLSLWPLAFYVEDRKKGTGRQFYYFNAIKSKKIEQLNYEWSSLIRDKELYKQFYKVLPLSEWRRIEEPEIEVFRSRMEALRENFKGREDERRMVKEFCLTGEGTLMLWGEPGIGKSALIAQVFEEIRGHIGPEGQEQVCGYPPMIQYFIKRGTVYEDGTYFLRYLNGRLDRLFGLSGYGLGETVPEMHDRLVERLDAIEEMEGEERLVLFVDGLDEEPQLRSLIPDSRRWFKVILSSRPVEQILDWYRSHDREKRSELTIEKLSRKDIRSILYTVVDRYQDEFTESYVEQVAERSEGNPLYLKLLCERIFENGGAVGKVEEIPQTIEDLYTETIKRVTEGGRDEDTLNVLVLLAVTHASLAASVIAYFLGINTDRAESSVEAVRELLYEDPDTEDVEDFQLFHESLHEWIEIHYRQECERMRKRVAELCYTWREIEEPYTLRYALEHGARHLLEAKEEEKLWNILTDEEYRQQQIEEFKQYNPALKALKIGITYYVNCNGTEEKDDERLTWLVLKAGDTGYRAQTDIRPAFQWFYKNPAFLEEALERLSQLDEVSFYQSVMLLLWLEADRQLEKPREERNSKYALRILKIAEERKFNSVLMDRLFSEDFIFWIDEKIHNVFGEDLKIEWEKFAYSHTKDKKKGIGISFSDMEIEGLSEGILLTKKDIDALRTKIGGTEEEKELNKIVSVTSVTEQINILTKIAKSLQNKNELEKVEKIYSIVINQFERLISAISALDNELEKRSALERIISSLENVGWTNIKLKIHTKLIDTIDEVYNSALGLDRCNEDKAYTLRQIAHSLSKISDIQDTTDLANKLYKNFDTNHDINICFYEKTITLGYIAEIFAKAYKSHKAFAIYEEAIHETRIVIRDEREKAFLYLSKSIASVNSFMNIDRLFEKLVENAGIQNYLNIKAGALKNIAEVFAGKVDRELVKETYEKAIETAEYSNDPKTLRKIVESLVNIKHHQRAKEILEKVVIHSVEAIDLKETQAVGFEKIAIGFANSDYFEKATDVAEVIMKDKYRHKKDALIEICKALVEKDSSEQEKIYAVFKRVIEILNTIHVKETKASGIISIAKILKIFTSINQIDNIFDQLIDSAEAIHNSADLGTYMPGPTLEKEEARFKVYALLEIAESLVKNGKQRKAVETYERTIHVESLITEDMYDSKYNKENILIAIAKSLKLIADVDETDRLYDELVEESNSIDDTERREKVLKSIAKSLRSSGRTQKAIKIYKRLIDTTKNESFKENIRVSLCFAFYIMDNFERACEVIEYIENSENKVHALCEIAEAEYYNYKKDTLKANKLYRMAMEVVSEFDEEINDDLLDADEALSAKVNALCRIAEYLNYSNNMQKSDEMYEKAIELVSDFDEELTEDVWVKEGRQRDIVESLLKSNRFEWAEKLAYSIEDSSYRPLPLSYLAQEYIEKGNIEKALEIIDTFDDEKSNFLADNMSSIANYLSRSRNNQQALSIVDLIINYDDKAEVLCKIAESFFEKKEFETAEDIYGRAIAAADKIKDNQNKAKVLEKIAQSTSEQNAILVFRNYLYKAQISSSVFKSVITEWQNSISEKNNKVQIIRESFKYIPFDIEISYNSVYNLIRSHLQDNNMRYAAAIFKTCPYLGLYNLQKVLGIEEYEYSYSTLNKWIHTVKDEKKRTKIETLAEMVEDGEMDEKKFNEKVKKFFKNNHKK